MGIKKYRAVPTDTSWGGGLERGIRRVIEKEMGQIYGKLGTLERER